MALWMYLNCLLILLTLMQLNRTKALIGVLGTDSRNHSTNNRAMSYDNNGRGIEPETEALNPHLERKDPALFIDKDSNVVDMLSGVGARNQDGSTVTSSATSMDSSIDSLLDHAFHLPFESHSNTRQQDQESTSDIIKYNNKENDFNNQQQQLSKHQYEAKNNRRHLPPDNGGLVNERVMTDHMQHDIANYPSMTVVVSSVRIQPSAGNMERSDDDQFDSVAVMVSAPRVLTLPATQKQLSAESSETSVDEEPRFISTLAASYRAIVGGDNKSSMQIEFENMYYNVSLYSVPNENQFEYQLSASSNRNGLGSFVSTNTGSANGLLTTTSASFNNITSFIHLTRQQLSNPVHLKWTRTATSSQIAKSPSQKDEHVPSLPLALKDSAILRLITIKCDSNVTCAQRRRAIRRKKSGFCWQNVDTSIVNYVVNHLVAQSTVTQAHFRPHRIGIGRVMAAPAPSTASAPSHDLSDQQQKQHGINKLGAKKVKLRRSLGECSSVNGWALFSSGPIRDSYADDANAKPTENLIDDREHRSNNQREQEEHDEQACLWIILATSKQQLKISSNVSPTLASVKNVIKQREAEEISLIVTGIEGKAPFEPTSSGGAEDSIERLRNSDDINNVAQVEDGRGAKRGKKNDADYDRKTILSAIASSDQGSSEYETSRATALSRIQNYRGDRGSQIQATIEREQKPIDHLRGRRAEYKHGNSSRSALSHIDGDINPEFDNQQAVPSARLVKQPVREAAVANRARGARRCDYSDLRQLGKMAATAASALKQQAASEAIERPNERVGLVEELSGSQVFGAAGQQRVAERREEGSGSGNSGKKFKSTSDLRLTLLRLAEILSSEISESEKALGGSSLVGAGNWHRLGSSERWRAKQADESKDNVASDDYYEDHARNNVDVIAKQTTTSTKTTPTSTSTKRRRKRYNELRQFALDHAHKITSKTNDTQVTTSSRLIKKSLSDEKSLAWLRNKLAHSDKSSSRSSGSASPSSASTESFIILDQADKKEQTRHRRVRSNDLTLLHKKLNEPSGTSDISEQTRPLRDQFAVNGQTLQSAAGSDRKYEKLNTNKKSESGSTSKTTNSKRQNHPRFNYHDNKLFSGTKSFAPETITRSLIDVVSADPDIISKRQFGHFETDTQTQNRTSDRQIQATSGIGLHEKRDKQHDQSMFNEELIELFALFYVHTQELQDRIDRYLAGRLHLAYTKHAYTNITTNNKIQPAKQNDSSNNQNNKHLNTTPVPSLAAQSSGSGNKTSTRDNKDNNTSISEIRTPTPVASTQPGSEAAKLLDANVSQVFPPINAITVTEQDRQNNNTNITSKSSSINSSPSSSSSSSSPSPLSSSTPTTSAPVSRVPLAKVQYSQQVPPITQYFARYKPAIYQRFKMHFGADDESLLKWLRGKQDQYSSLKNITIDLISEPPTRAINVCFDGPKIWIFRRLDGNKTLNDIYYCYTHDQWIEKLWLDWRPSPYHYPLLALNILIFLFGATGNIFVCLSVYRNHQLRNVTNYHIVNLAIADLLVIIICLPATSIWDVSLTWFFGTIPCKLIMYLQDVSISVSVLTLAAISIDRYYAICFPLRFKSSLSKAKRVICCIWLLSLIIMLPDLIYLAATQSLELSEAGLNTVLYSDCNYTWSEQSSRLFQYVKTILLYFLPFVFMSVAHFRIMRTLRISTVSAPVNNSTSCGQQEQKESGSPAPMLSFPVEERAQKQSAFLGHNASGGRSTLEHHSTRTRALEEEPYDGKPDPSDKLFSDPTQGQQHQQQTKDQTDVAPHPLEPPQESHQTSSNLTMPESLHPPTSGYNKRVRRATLHSGSLMTGLSGSVTQGELISNKFAANINNIAVEQEHQYQAIDRSPIVVNISHVHDGDNHDSNQEQQQDQVDKLNDLQESQTGPSTSELKRATDGKGRSQQRAGMVCSKNIQPRTDIEKVGQLNHAASGSSRLLHDNRRPSVQRRRSWFANTKAVRTSGARDDSNARPGTSMASFTKRNSLAGPLSTGRQSLLLNNRGSFCVAMHNKSQLESRRNAAKMLMAIVIFFGLSHLPVHLMNFLRHFIEDLPQNDFTLTMSMVAHSLCHLNSAINPVIYNYMNSKLSKTIDQLLELKRGAGPAKKL